MNWLMVLCFIINIAVFAFAFTRPTSAWLAADRDRAFWLWLIGIAGFMGVLGIAADVAFLLGVLPRMLSTQTSLPPRPENARIQPNPFTKS